MITKRSIDLTLMQGPCHALEIRTRACKVLEKKEEKCCSWRCPFYKPIAYADYVRIEDRQGINLVPWDEWLKARGVM